MIDPRRQIPGTDVVLGQPRFVEAARTLGHPLVKAAIIAAQERARAGTIPADEVADAAFANLPRSASSLGSVLNATGIVVHTNLGRAPLSAAAIDAAAEAAGSTDVEFDLGTGRRARRGRGTLDALAEAVPEAEAVHVVNNNASALLLCALAVAGGKEIVVSKGELVEIGDGFRIPELVASTGATLREVGTTNRTSLADYAEAVGSRTGFLLKVHPSNFRITGFTGGVEIAELAVLGVPVIADIGSGLLVPHPRLPEEPDARSALRAGASVVTASADKLLGGPQAGLMVGTAEVIERLRRHPSARALRVDKLTLAALEATLRGPTPPVRQALDASETQLWDRANRIAEVVTAAAAAASGQVDVYPARSVAAVGGGGAPGVELPSAAVSLPVECAEPLRRGTPPVVGRVEDGRCVLDLCAVPPDDDDVLLEAVRRCMS